MIEAPTYNSNDPSTYEPTSTEWGTIASTLNTGFGMTESAASLAEMFSAVTELEKLRLKRIAIALAFLSVQVP